MGTLFLQGASRDNRGDPQGRFRNKPVRNAVCVVKEGAWQFASCCTGPPKCLRNQSSGPIRPNFGHNPVVLSPGLQLLLGLDAGRPTAAILSHKGTLLHLLLSRSTTVEASRASPNPPAHACLRLRYLTLRYLTLGRYLPTYLKVPM